MDKNEWEAGMQVLMDVGDPPMVQKTQDEVNYRTSDGQAASCGQCQHFQPPSSCMAVAGTISPTYVCDLFMAPPAGAKKVEMPKKKAPKKPSY